ncbi:outer membrane beta-barrel protein [Methylocystis sp. WRRC1]|uniref:outer membrane protein n=1 Tax=unclassified Methylocystis TaxID=2625913 RepID=UPI0001F873CD|nr:MULTISPECIES: outer membrane beta-barrel protein [unclassified Methylocystis]MCC3244221.1 outer membrane beta-barrel protein [Methylocystis sp. WRRC1]
MKKTLLTAVSLAVLAAGSAFAADLPSRKEAPVYVPPPPPPPMWTGFYAGVNIGGGWDAGNGNGNAWNLFGANGGVTNNMSGGVVGGGQVGYNYQITPMFLVGVETDFQGTSMGSGMNNNNWLWGWNGRAQGTSLDWFGTVRGRAGVTITPTLLVYGTGGFAYAGVQRNGGFQTSATQTGWTAGGGVEWMFMPNWSAKAEYLYTDVSGGGTNNWWFQNNAGLGLNSTNNHTRWNTIRAGVNYHFNFGAGAPVIAKY